MPSCKKCGAYTKYNNGLCYGCYSKNNSKAGNVYIGEIKFSDGKKKLYTGQTKRSVFQRVSEHLAAQRDGNTKTYTGRGIGFKLLGSIFSTNRFKAEKTIKKFTPTKKRNIARYGARKYKKY